MIARIKAVELLVTAGFEVSARPERGGGIGLVVSRDGESAVVDPSLRQRTAAEWADVLRELENADERVVVVVTSASRRLIEVAKRDGRLNIVSLGNRFIVWNREEITPLGALATAHMPSAVSNGRFKPWGRWAIMRAYLLNGEPRSQVMLARETGVTQKCVTMANWALGSLVVKSADGWLAVNRPALWERFLAEYSGPGGTTTHWCGRETITDESDSVLAAGESTGVQTLCSGDSAADRLAPWRVPLRAVVYATAGLPLETLGLTQTTRERATLTFTVPADRTVWRTAALWSQHRATRTVDPVIAAWDVSRTGGPDADGAVARLRDLVLAS